MPKKLSTTELSLAATVRVVEHPRARTPASQRPEPQEEQVVILDLTMILMFTAPQLLIVIGFLASIYAHAH